MQVPTNEISIGHPTSTTKSLAVLTHHLERRRRPAGDSPELQRATGISQGFQALYSGDGAGGWTLDHTAPIVGPMIWDPPRDYRFALTKFWLYTVANDGGLGSLVATSTKVDFFMTADTFVGGVPNTQNSTAYPGSNCSSPAGTLGLDVGWGDK